MIKLRKAKISFVQFESLMMDVQGNLKKTEEFVVQASKEGSDLIVFPELYTTGYNPDTIGSKFSDLAEDENGPTVQMLKKLALEYQINIIAPIAFIEKVAGVPYNSAVVVNRQGEFIGAYHKTHLWAQERYFFKEGVDLPVFDLDIGKVGVMICYDGGFPEVSRGLALNGAELIVCPSAFPIQDKDMWDIYFKSRALENACFVAGVNRVGHEGARHMFGNNQLYNPRGKELLYAPMDEEGIQTVEIDLQDVTEYRKEVPYLKDLKAELYKKIDYK